MSEKEKVRTEFVVDCDRWLRGREYDSYLKDNNGRMCCLGFVTEQLGVDPGSMVTTPQELRCPVPFLTRSVGGEPDTPLTAGGELNTTLTLQAMELNDSPDISDEERATRLSKLFQDHDLTLRFKFAPWRKRTRTAP